MTEAVMGIQARQKISPEQQERFAALLEQMAAKVREQCPEDATFSKDTDLVEDHDDKPWITKVPVATTITVQVKWEIDEAGPAT